jgi:hypothetical protein
MGTGHDGGHAPLRPSAHPPERHQPTVVAASAEDRTRRVLTVLACCAAMLLLTASTHYEALNLLNAALPPLPIPGRLKVLVLFIAVFAAHVLETLMYALAYHLLPRLADVGGLSNGAVASFASCLYFSAETFTSLGFGDVTPSGPLRLLAGMETLNGLLLVGWSASYIHLAMERFWPAARGSDPAKRREIRRRGMRP